MYAFIKSEKTQWKSRRKEWMDLTARQATNTYIDTSNSCAVVGGKNASGVNWLGRESTVLFDVMPVVHAGIEQEGFE
jgi:hypothetical protein